MADWVCGSLTLRLHLATLLWLQMNLYCADSNSQTNDLIYSRWQQPYWDVFVSLFYSGRKRRCIIHLFYSLWCRPEKCLKCRPTIRTRPLFKSYTRTWLGRHRADCTRPDYVPILHTKCYQVNKQVAEKKQRFALITVSSPLPDCDAYNSLCQ